MSKEKKDKLEIEISKMTDAHISVASLVENVASEKARRILTKIAHVIDELNIRVSKKHKDYAELPKIKIDSHGRLKDLYDCYTELSKNYGVQCDANTMSICIEALNDLLKKK